MKELILDKIRIQFLSKDIIRVEYNKNKEFLDETTFFITNRNVDSKNMSLKLESDEFNYIVSFGDYILKIPFKQLSLNGVCILNKQGEIIYKYKKITNSGELPSLNKTPEIFPLIDSPRIIIPNHEYSYIDNIDNNGFFIEKQAQDLYLLITNKDPIKLRKLYVEITGRNELVPLSLFGLFNSKYYKYTQKEAEQVILDYKQNDIPLDTIVIDTDWRLASDRGIGYDVNTSLFPDMKGFFTFAHNHHVEVMFNDHPEPVEKASHLLDPKEVKYRESRLQEHLKNGLDYWWYDRNWSTKLISPIKKITPETFGLYLFHNITKHHYQSIAKNNNIYRRPIIMGNVDDIRNGKYVKVNSSASHRYSIQWTGDIGSDYSTLQNEIKNMIKASNNCVAYVNSDCGGHTGNPDKNTYIRWLQFGIFTPILRPHCTNSCVPFREPWVYDRQTLDISREYINLRYRLLPLIYKQAFENYQTGLPIFKSLSYYYPNDNKALNNYSEYMLDNCLLIAPYFENSTKPLPKKVYQQEVKATYFDNVDFKGKPILIKNYSKIHRYLYNTRAEKEVPIYNYSTIYETSIKFDDDVDLYVVSDDGVSVFINDELMFEDKRFHASEKNFVASLNKNTSYKVCVKHFQGGGESIISLEYAKRKRKSTKSFYLPNGNWIDPFTNKEYLGNKTYRREFKIHEMPLFIKLGSLIPLIDNAQNTKLQTWNRMTFDYYPSKDHEYTSYIYEDDTLSTAYKYNQYSISPFSAKYNYEEDCFEICFYKTKGKFEGNRYISNRNITLKIHKTKEIKGIHKILINNKELPFKEIKKIKDEFILTTGEKSNSTIYSISFNHKSSSITKIKIYLKIL